MIRSAIYQREEPAMDWKLELVQVPVSDVDRAKAFYTEKAGFNADHDHRVSDEIRFVQLTPPRPPRPSRERRDPLRPAHASGLGLLDCHRHRPDPDGAGLGRRPAGRRG